MDGIASAVREWIADTGLSPNQVSRRAGISQSTMSRILGGRVDPAAGTLNEIALACGLQLDLATRASSEPAAARAARALLEAGYPTDPDGHLTRWQERLARYAGTSDPVDLLTTAARYASPLRSPDVALFTGTAPLGQVASAGQASQGRWALSGAAGLTLPQPHDDAPITTILWAEHPREATQLLTDSTSAPPAPSDRRALAARDCAVLEVEPGSALAS
ncbi:helix-turn-helix domain-containing protein [Skermania piniformis]|uniref:Helix-turn-helix domain-containing protein n=1 Tax=Skermania pinensis TaxID=39122 RepID=A0ABX8SBQ1_9ACTN|nr:helix-turn-helix transcriptional regulator [Skermania piniformis]QXQ15295.1 helix-turn-helix domain-containing protein [Skermania piniformis]